MKKILAVLLALICSISPLLGTAAALLGDIDSDTGITAADARLALRAAVGLETFDAALTAVADVDGDGEVTAGDARLLLRTAVGLPTDFPIGLEMHTEHIWDEGSVTLAPACENAGEKTYTCTVCGETKREALPALEHEWSESAVVTPPTCVDEGQSEVVCKLCGKTERTPIPATGEHTWDAGVTTLRPTYTAPGEYLYTCTVCGAKYTEEIPVRIEDRKERLLNFLHSVGKKTGSVWEYTRKVTDEFSSTLSYDEAAPGDGILLTGSYYYENGMRFAYATLKLELPAYAYRGEAGFVGFGRYSFYLSDPATFQGENGVEIIQQLAAGDYPMDDKSAAAIIAQLAYVAVTGLDLALTENGSDFSIRDDMGFLAIPVPEIPAD